MMEIFDGTDLGDLYSDHRGANRDHRKMEIKLGNTPMEIIWDLQKVNAPLKGKCFDNCMLAVLS
jgi:hypothetical protein